MDLHRNRKIIKNDLLLQKIVYCIQKAVGEDQKDYLRNNQKETTNVLGQLRGDNINTNLRDCVVDEEIKLLPFQRSSWQGRLIVDTVNCYTYSISALDTLKGIPRKKNRTRPHYLQTVLSVENEECKAESYQMSLNEFGITVFEEEELSQDFETINQGFIDNIKDYRHYNIVYRAEHGILREIYVQFLDRSFDIVDQVSLNQCLKPDFADLTDEHIIEDENIVEKKSILKPRQGLKPKIREIDKRERK